MKLVLDEDEMPFDEYYYYLNSPSVEKYNDLDCKEEFYEAEEYYKDNKDNSSYTCIEKATKALSKDINKDFEKEFEEKNIIDININLEDNSLFIKKEDKEENLEKKQKNEKTETKKCGRKRGRNNGNNKNEHNKYSDDNIRRKIKHIILKYTLKFLNIQIKKVYNGNIGKGILKKELQTLNQTQKTNATINFNKEFLNKELGEIFSDNISGRYTNYSPYYNKILIVKLLNEKDENKRIYFRKLFSLTFNDCLKHFRGGEHIDLLDGLICFKDIQNEIINKYDDGNDYYETMKYYLDNYERIIYNKKARKPREKKDE